MKQALRLLFAELNYLRDKQLLGLPIKEEKQ